MVAERVEISVSGGANRGAPKLVCHLEDFTRESPKRKSPGRQMVVSLFEYGIGAKRGAKGEKTDSDSSNRIQHFPLVARW